MRVVVVSAWPPWLAERGDGSALILSRHLRELGPRHDMSLLTTAGPAPTHVVEGGVPVRAFGTRLPGPADYAVRRLRSLRDGEPTHVRWVTRRGLLRALAREVETRPDVVHLFGWGTAGLWRRLHGIPAVHTAVDPWARTIGNRGLPAWRRWSDRGQVAAVERHERRHYPHLAAVVLVTEPDAALLSEQVPGARFVVVPNGVDAGPDPRPLPPGPPVLAFHGSFMARANVEAAVALVEQVLPQVQAVLPDARVVLAGQQPGPEVQRLAGPGVEVLASVPDIRAVLNRAHVHVDMMSSASSAKNEVLEAFAAGRPVVATPQGLQGLAGTGGTVVVPNAAAAADAIVDLVRRPGALADLGRAGRKRVLAQSWASSARRLEQVWAEAASRG